MITLTKSLLASYMGLRYGVTEKTTRLFILKLREVMSLSDTNQMDVEVNVDGSF